jgi:hypothetical protein
MLPAGRPNPFSNGDGMAVHDDDAPPQKVTRAARVERRVVLEFERRPWLPWAVFYVIEIGLALYIGWRIDHLANTIQLK